MVRRKQSKGPIQHYKDVSTVVQSLEYPTDPNTSTHWKFGMKILHLWLIPVTVRDPSENTDPNNGNILQSPDMF